MDNIVIGIMVLASFAMLLAAGISLAQIGVFLLCFAAIIAVLAIAAWFCTDKDGEEEANIAEEKSESGR